MAQVPDSFDITNPCIVTATSSGSRGVYGAVSAAGEWGLKRGCAVAYTDKGTGSGAHELATDTVTLVDGTIASAMDAGTASLFTATLLATGQNRPNRYAFKHAHSQQNPSATGASTRCRRSSSRSMRSTRSSAPSTRRVRG
jgi:hydroxybutyrate-dimer hydrolase